MSQSPDLFASENLLGEYIEASSIMNSHLPDAQEDDWVQTMLDLDSSDEVMYVGTEMGTPKEVLVKQEVEQAGANVVGAPAQARGGNTRSATPPPPRASQKRKDVVEEEKDNNKKQKKDGSVIPRGNAAKYWCFTAHFDEGMTVEQVEEKGHQLFAILAKKCKKIAMQVEKCPETGRLHIQGCIEAETKLRWTEFQLNKKMNLFPHFEKQEGTWAQNVEYCTKEDTRVGRMWLKGVMVNKKVKVLREDQLRPWQTQCLEVMTEEADDRTVWWIWSTNGGVGKSSFAKYCAVTLQGVMVANGKACDILAQVVQYRDSNGFWPRIIIMNLPRCCEGHVSYMALEQMKDGLGMSSKYEGGQIIMDPAHCFVFANTPPDYTKMSNDRFKVICLDDFEDQLGSQ